MIWDDFWQISPWLAKFERKKSGLDLFWIRLQTVIRIVYCQWLNWLSEWKGFTHATVPPARISLYMRAACRYSYSIIHRRRLCPLSSVPDGAQLKRRTRQTSIVLPQHCAPFNYKWTWAQEAQDQDDWNINQIKSSSRENWIYPFLWLWRWQDVSFCRGIQCETEAKRR
jgi:hypothetical protein